MNTGVISVRYARALLEYAVKLGAEDATYQNMLQLLGTFNSVKELPVVLRDPHLSAKERTALICAAVEPSPAFSDFAALVVKQGREEMLPFMAHAYIELYRKKKGILAAKFVTASPVSEEFCREVAAIVGRNSGSTVELECVTDAQIIGGFIIEADSRRLDASVKGQIEKIRKVLVKQNRKLV